MKRYHLWTVGCQMNKADSAKFAAGLDSLGYEAVDDPAAADVVVLNTCAVRQGAEERAIGMLGRLRKAKERRGAGYKIAVMGCMVGLRTTELERRFPFVDVFARPQAFDDVIVALGENPADLGGEFWPEAIGEPDGPAAFVPVVNGCDKFCTYCIVPYRRGRERSRPIDDVEHEVRALAARGVREVTLLGQTVEAYGHDLDASGYGGPGGRPDLVGDLFHDRGHARHVRPPQRQMVHDGVAELPPVEARQTQIDERQTLTPALSTATSQVQVGHGPKYERNQPSN